MTGSSSEVSSASSFRLVRRSDRPAMICHSAAAAGLTAKPAAGPGAVSSDTGSLLFWVVARLLGGRGGGVAGQGQEHVVQRRGMYGEPLHRRALGVDFVEQRAHVRRAPVGRNTDGAGALVKVNRAGAELTGKTGEERGIGEHQVQPLIGYLLLELGWRTLGDYPPVVHHGDTVRQPVS